MLFEKLQKEWVDSLHEEKEDNDAFFEDEVIPDGHWLKRNHNLVKANTAKEKEEEAKFMKSVSFDDLLKVVNKAHVKPPDDFIGVDNPDNFILPDDGENG